MKNLIVQGKDEQCYSFYVNRLHGAFVQSMILTALKTFFRTFCVQQKKIILVWDDMNMMTEHFGDKNYFKELST